MVSEFKLILLMWKGASIVAEDNKMWHPLHYAARNTSSVNYIFNVGLGRIPGHFQYSAGYWIPSGFRISGWFLMPNIRKFSNCPAVYRISGIRNQPDIRYPAKPYFKDFLAKSKCKINTSFTKTEGPNNRANKTGFNIIIFILLFVEN